MEEQNKVDKPTATDQEKSQEIYLTSYQQRLHDEWKKTHGDQPAPLVPNNNGTARWMNRKERRALASIKRRKSRR